MSFKKTIAVIAVIAVAAVSLSACSLLTRTSETAKESDSAVTALSATTDTSELFTERDLDPSYDDESAVHITLADKGIKADDSTNVTIDGSTVTIKDEGVYVLSGSLSDGQIIVDAEDTDKVQLVLNGVTVSSTETAAIYVKTADKVFITTVKGTDNSFSESGEFAADGDTNVDAVIFSKSDLTLCGEGTLTVTTQNGNGITSKDDLKLTLGTYSVTVSGKGLEANDSVRIAGGSFTIETGDDGIHSDGATTINGGTFNITKSYEGIEGHQIYINGGDITINATDDGLNAAGGNDQSGFGSRMDEFAADGEALIEINGGTLTINADGDGIDSNGNLTVSAGTVTVDGPINAGNGALDYNGTASITGGTLIAVGAAGMAENFNEATQGTIMVNFQQSASGAVTVTDSDGNTLLSYTPSKAYCNVVVSSPDLKKGETYTVTAGSESQEVTLDDYIYGEGSGMGMGGMPGGNRGEMPTDESGSMPEPPSGMPEGESGSMPEPPSDMP